MEYLKLIEDKEGFVHWDGATEQEIVTILFSALT